MVIVEELDENATPAPATNEALLELPFKLKFVAVGTAGPEMVTTCSD